MERSGRHAIAFLALFTATAAAWGCATDAAGPGSELSARIVLDVGALTQQQPQPPGPSASTIALARMTVNSAAGQTVREAPLGADDPAVEFTVTVPVGQLRVDAEVLSNNGSVLYSGTGETIVQADGFELEVDLSPRAPVLVATPASLPVDSLHFEQFPEPFRLTNRGLRTTIWSIESVTPALDSCGDIPCLWIAPDAGEIPAGQMGGVVVVALNTPAREYEIRLQSAEGTVDVMALAAAVTPTGTINVRVVRPGAPPIADHTVRLVACLMTFRDPPPVCTRDPVIPELVRTTDPEGRTRFTSLRGGNWYVRPDSIPDRNIVPSDTILRLEAGGSAEVIFWVF